MHIRCGSDIRYKLHEAGFRGDFLKYSDTVCQGPVPDLPDLIPIRSAFLAEAYGSFVHLTEAQLTSRLRDEEERPAAAHEYDRVVLWFEHNSYDQLVLARCLANLGRNSLPACLELICIDRHPDIRRFIGLGQLSAAALVALWPARTAVTPAQIALGESVWAALRRPDPACLRDIAVTGTPALPIAAPALRRHLQELPDAADGLSWTQRLVLEILSEQPAPIGRIFGTLVAEREKLPFLGDIQLLPIIEVMAGTKPPVPTSEAGEKPFQRFAAITETGRDVLGGAVDFLSLEPAERWVGGVRITAGQPTWRITDPSGQINFA